MPFLWLHRLNGVIGDFSPTKTEWRLTYTPSIGDNPPVRLLLNLLRTRCQMPFDFPLTQSVSFEIRFPFNFGVAMVRRLSFLCHFSLLEQGINACARLPCASHYSAC
jgi:hypothetical protein